MTCVELTGLLIVIAAAATLLADGGGEPGRVLEFTENETMISATFAGTLLAFYSFVGFETTANVAEEIKDPSRVYPRALFGALIAAGVMYALIGMAATSSLPVGDLAESTGPLLSVVDVSPLNVPDRVFSLIALVAVANGALLTMIMSSRLTYGMSVQGNLPGLFSRVLSVRRTPIVAIVATTVVAIGLTFLGDLATLAETVVLLLLFVFLSTNVAVLVLKKDEVDHEHFRVWRVVPVLATVSCLVLLTQQSSGVWIRGLALVAVGALLFAFMNWRRKAKVPAE
jgi:amino acid transporter